MAQKHATPIIESSTAGTKTRKPVDWATTGSYVGGIIGVLLLPVLGVWRSGVIVIILYTFACAGIGAAIGVGIEKLLNRTKQ